MTAQNAPQSTERCPSCGHFQVEASGRRWCINPQCSAHGKLVNPPSFEKNLERLINRHSIENGSNTPDFILAEYLRTCLNAFNSASRAREKWYGRELEIGPSDIPPMERTMPVFGVENGKPPKSCPLVGCAIDGPHEHQIQGPAQNKELKG